MLEKEIEKKLRQPIRQMGGLYLKLVCPGFTGVPDRLILLPGGHVLFVETKAPGKRERPRQGYVQGLLARMGFMVFSSVDSVTKVDIVIERCRRLVYGNDV